MDNQSPGVVLMNKYDTPSTSSQGYSGYLNYISRNNAVAPKNFDQYLLYMDDDRKQANLFTADQDFLTREEKESLQEKFSQAEQKNGLMWETVISFNNEWLEEHGLYRSSDGWTDEKELKRLTRGAVRELEDKNHLNLTWTGAIHHNTDNIHIHIASVEKIPRIQEKEYQIIEFPESWLKEHQVLTPENLSEMRRNVRMTTTKEVNGTLAYQRTMRQLRDAVKEETGRPFFCRNQIELTSQNTIRVSLGKNAGAIPKEAKVIDTYRSLNATFRESSMNRAKGYIVQEILNNRDDLTRVNHLIRDQMVNPTRNQFSEFLIKDESVSRDFLKLYHDMKAEGISRRDWNYGTNKIAKFRPEIDKLSQKILETHFPIENDEFHSLVHNIGEEYRKAYGNSEKADQYESGREQDLKKRMGNAVCQSLRNYDRQRVRERNNSQSAKEKNSASKKRTRAKLHSQSHRKNQQEDYQRLQNTIQQLERDAQEMIAVQNQEERERLYQVQQEISEEAWQEQQRIQQGDLEAQASISK